MTTELAPYRHFSEEQVELIKRTICKGATDDELALFLYQCQRTGLDPFSRQIHAVKRKEKRGNGFAEVMTVQTGIDGYRLIADRTGRYAPGKEPTYTYDDNGHIVNATAYVKKLVGGVWHEYAATAYWHEYAQTYPDGNLLPMWRKMPHNQLAKCAESLALRRGFPAELSGIYTNEEMGQADIIEAVVSDVPQKTLVGQLKALHQAERDYCGATVEIAVELRGVPVAQMSVAVLQAEVATARGRLIEAVVAKLGALAGNSSQDVRDFANEYAAHDLDSYSNNELITLLGEIHAHDV
jgi:phage recombination protein Bet